MTSHHELPSLIGWRLTSVKNYAHSCNEVGEYASGGDFWMVENHSRRDVIALVQCLLSLSRSSTAADACMMLELIKEILDHWGYARGRDEER